MNLPQFNLIPFLLTSPLADFSLVCATIAAVILLTFLIRKPPLPGAPSESDQGHHPSQNVVRLWLLLGLGVFPIGAAVSGNIQGFQATTKRSFCGSCHVMTPHASDSNDPKSRSLASRHARNDLFGSENCYACHADYGMFGTAVTKIGGMRHVWLYFTEYKNVSLEDAKKSIHLVQPYKNENCMHCHSTKNDLWQAVADHRGALDEVRSNRISCASVGCHGYAHPMTKAEAKNVIGDKP